MSTIYALSTASGKSAVAVVRVSGPRARDVLEKLTLGQRTVSARQASLRTIIHPQTRDRLDRALTLFFEAPRTFTGEDTCEFHLHGSRAVVKSVLDVIPLCHPDVRYAEPGEFSKRAFRNGKLDLTQAEGLADLINAETDEQRKSALRQAEGVLSTLYDGWRSELIAMRSLFEAVIDFGEDNDGIDHNIYEQVFHRAKLLRAIVFRHLDSSLKGELLRTGIEVVICGPPNAGKSSLVNLLSQRDASIVSPEAGTTRDVVETILDIGGFPVILGDTAGLRSGAHVGSVEQEGIRRARARITRANLRICVLPNGEPLDKDMTVELKLLVDQDPQAVMILLNKTDLLRNSPNRDLVKDLHVLAPGNVYEISCMSRAGIEPFLNGLVQKLRDLTSNTDAMGEEVLGTNARHRDQLQKCLSHIDAVIENDRRDIVIGAEELRYASDALGRVVGRIDVEEILGKIFSSFCIGK